MLPKQTSMQKITSKLANDGQMVARKSKIILVKGVSISCLVQNTGIHTAGAGFSYKEDKKWMADCFF